MPPKKKFETAKPSMTAPPHLVYQLKVSLRNAPYPIWRVLLVDGEIDLEDLQILVIRCMDGWDFSHLSDLRIGRDTYSSSSDDFFGGKDASEYRLCDVLGEKGKCVVTYDFGDSWEHIVTVMKIEPNSTAETPFCIRGRGACPPEDSGGVYGFAYKLKVLSDPNDDEFEEIKGWMGDFDPENFSIERINANL